MYACRRRWSLRAGETSDVIAPHGCCAGYEANYGKLHDTRPDAEEPEKNKEKKTTADVTQDLRRLTQSIWNNK
jgi:hypothetical protein